MNIVRPDGLRKIEPPAVAPGRHADTGTYIVLLALVEDHPEGGKLLLEATPEEAVDLATAIVAAADKAREWDRAEAAGDVAFEGL